MNPEIREMLLGYKIELASSYYRPTEQEMLEEYERAQDNLTISQENRLKQKVEKLEVDKKDYETLEKRLLAIEDRILHHRI